MWYGKEQKEEKRKRDKERWKGQSEEKYVMSRKIKISQAKY